METKFKAMLSRILEDILNTCLKKELNMIKKLVASKNESSKMSPRNMEEDLDDSDDASVSKKVQLKEEYLNELLPQTNRKLHSKNIFFLSEGKEFSSQSI